MKGQGGCLAWSTKGEGMVILTLLTPEGETDRQTEKDRQRETETEKEEE